MTDALCIHSGTFTIYTPTNRSNAQHLVEYEKQLLYEENKKSGNVMQQPMDSYVCGTNLRSESSLVLSDLLFRVKYVYQNSTGTSFFARKVNMT